MSYRGRAALTHTQPMYPHRVARRPAATILWLVGPRPIEDHIRPRLADAADEVGRPDPRILCSLPICVTDDAAGVREAAAQVFAVSGELPSDRARLDGEGGEQPGRGARGGWPGGRA